MIKDSELSTAPYVGIRVHRTSDNAANQQESPMRKRSTRYPVQAPVQYRISGERTWHRGMSRNISESGILFEGEVPLGVGARFDMQLTLPTGVKGRTGPCISFRAAVVRCSQEHAWAARLFGAGIRRRQTAFQECKPVGRVRPRVEGNSRRIKP